jgi:hypothetical protein
MSSRDDHGYSPATLHVRAHGVTLASMAKAGTGNGNDLVRRNRALLTQAAATRAYTLLLFDEAGEAALEAYAARLRARDLLWRRNGILAGSSAGKPDPLARFLWPSPKRPGR